MEYRRLGSSDVQVSAITFGAWAIGGWMWGGAEHNDAIRAIRASYDMGVTSIDTAPVYGQGRSEELVGEAIRDIPRDRVQLLTKFGMRWDLKKGDFAFHSSTNSGKPIDVYKYGGKESVIKECEDSLKRLGTDYIDLYQQHWPDVTTPIEETMEALSMLLQQGKIRAAGVSNYNVMQMQKAETVLSLASNQVPYSMVERSIEKELVPYCLKQGKAIIAYSPLQRGLLTGKIGPDYPFAVGDHRPSTAFFQPGNLERTNRFLEKIRPVANDHQVPLSQVVIQWTLQQPGITVALVGARNEQQAMENARAARLNLGKAELELIQSELEKLVIEK